LNDSVHRVGVGNASTTTVKAHIIKRAKALGLTDKLPENWKENMADSSSLTDQTTPTSDIGTPKKVDPKAPRGNGYTKLKEMMRQKFQEMMALVIEDEKEEGQENEPDQPKEVKLPAGGLKVAADKASVPVSAPAEIQKGVIMAEPTQATPPVAPVIAPPVAETFTVEDFKAIKAQAEKDRIELMAVKAQAENFAAQLAATTRARRHDQLVARYEEFNAIPSPCPTGPLRPGRVAALQRTGATGRSPG
jgi:hypothetical protein